MANARTRRVAAHTRFSCQCAVCCSLDTATTVQHNWRALPCAAAWDGTNACSVCLLCDLCSLCDWSHRYPTSQSCLKTTMSRSRRNAEGSLSSSRSYRVRACKNNLLSSWDSILVLQPRSKLVNSKLVNSLSDYNVMFLICFIDIIILSLESAFIYNFQLIQQCLKLRLLDVN